MDAKRFTIFVLLYGDHGALARRCLDSVVRTCSAAEVELRVALNACGPASRLCVEQLVQKGRIKPEHVYPGPESRHKYPTMRAMFFDPGHPVTTPYSMWFDDDSYLLSTANGKTRWLERVAHKMAAADMLGAIHQIRLRGNQHLWVADQPWFNGQQLKKGETVRFVTGAWWTIRTELVRNFNWPVPELDHRGGDVMLGALCQQQRLRMAQFTDSVAINADDMGRSGKSRRRGFDALPIGVNYEPGPLRKLCPAPTPARRPMLVLDL